MLIIVVGTLNGGIRCDSVACFFSQYGAYIFTRFAPRQPTYFLTTSTKWSPTLNIMICWAFSPMPRRLKSKKPTEKPLSGCTLTKIQMTPLRQLGSKRLVKLIRFCLMTV